MTLAREMVKKSSTTHKPLQLLSCFVFVLFGEVPWTRLLPDSDILWPGLLSESGQKHRAIIVGP